MSLGRVRVVNRTPYRHRSLDWCGVAFPPGAVVADVRGRACTPTGAPIGVPGAVASAVEALGWRWPDGSVRFGRLCLVDAAPATSDRWLDLGPVQPASLTLSTWTAQLAGMIQPRLTVTLANGTRCVSNIDPQDGGLGQVLSVTDAAHVSLFRERIAGTTLLWELGLAIGHDVDGVRFWVCVYNSDPSTPAVRQDWTEIRFDSLLPAQFHARSRTIGPDAQVVSPAPGLDGAGSSFSWRFSAADYAGDGQGFWWFEGVWPLGAGRETDPVRLEALQAMATWPLEISHDGMAQPGLCGPLGSCGELPAGQTLAQADAATTQRAQAWAAGGPVMPRWATWPYGEFPDTANTGEHPTHGVSKLAPEILTVNPRAKAELLVGCLGEGRRTMFRFEPDLTPVLKRNHPDLVYWSGKPHWSTSRDKLGKTAGQVTPADAHGWDGPDPEHWMAETFLGPAALWTADWRLLHMGRHRMEQIKGHGYRQLGEWATRAQAWASHTMAWWILALGDAEDMAFARGWLDWLTQYVRQWRQVGPVRPSYVMRDPRYFPEPVGAAPGSPLQEFWIVWQHSFLVPALLGLHRVTGHADALLVATEISRTHDLYGWDPVTNQPFGGVAWQAGGTPLAPAQMAVYVRDVQDPVTGRWYKTPGWVTSSAGTDWILWAWGALQAGEWLAQQVGDQTWLQRNRQIQASVRASVGTHPVRAAKLAQWSGAVPVAPVVP